MKLYILILVLGLFCTGCQTEEEPVICRVVTGVEVQYSQDGAQLQRTYTQPESVQSVLNYLRLLDPYGPGLKNAPLAETCRITLRYSQGPDCVYTQAGNQYLRRDDGLWKNIQSTQAQLLYPMLRLLPSDA